MNDAEMISQSGYRKAFRYFSKTVQSGTSRFSTTKGLKDADLEAVEKLSTNALELVFFPSYARTTTRSGNELCVNIHGWLYSPVPAGKQSRRNRYTMLLARSIAGLPSLPAAGASTEKGSPRPGTAESTAKSSVDSTGLRQARSEPLSCGDAPTKTQSSYSAAPTSPGTSRSQTFPLLTKLPENGVGSLARSSSMVRQDSMDSNSSKISKHYSDHDLVNCHANLASRISPFLSKPISGQSIKCDVLANGVVVASTQLLTGDNGHFRGSVKLSTKQLDLASIKTVEARVNEKDFSASTDVHFVQDSGISIISDMDDTVKHTNIVAGMREAFRNAFVRNLQTLEISGVRQWYAAMRNMGCQIHYVSNAPYQLWPCLAAFIKIAGLPAGSIHLKQYSGLLQGMFEPAAEKKRANVEKILMDFPGRKFILIGDSGEQDLELYSELAHSEFKKQILGIFIRDVSSSVDSGAATPTGETGEDFFSAGKGDDIVDEAQRPEAAVPPRLPARPAVSLLVDLEPSAKSVETPHSSHMQDMLSVLASQPSPIPETTSKDAVLKPGPDSPDTSEMTTPTKMKQKDRPNLPRKPTALRFRTLQDKGAESSDDQTKIECLSGAAESAMSSSTPLKVSLPALAGTMRRPTLMRASSASSYYGEGRRITKAQERTQAWEARLARARAGLPKGIKLYTWKEGSDCQDRAEELIRNTLRDI